MKLKTTLTLLLTLLLTACEGGTDSSTTTTNSNTSTVTTETSFAGYWSGSANVKDTDGSRSATIESFISESGFTIVVVDGGDGVLFGNMNYVSTAGTGTLTEFDGGEISYTASATLTNGELILSVNNNNVSASATLKADTSANTEYKKQRKVSDLDGTWFEYESTSPNLITLSDGSAAFQFNNGGCNATLALTIASNNFSEFNAKMRLSDCDDNDYNGNYNGLAFVNQDNSSEAFTLFVYNDTAWIGTDFKRQ